MAIEDIEKLLKDISAQATYLSDFCSTKPSTLEASERETIRNFATYSKECLDWYRQSVINQPGHSAVLEFYSPIALGAIEIAHANVMAVGRNFERVNRLNVDPAPANLIELGRHSNSLNIVMLESAVHPLSHGIDILYARLPGQGRPAYPGFPTK